MKTNSSPQARTANCDQELLDASPSFLSIGDLFKAVPASEGSKRFVYLEASNQSRDLQGEVLLAKALEDSADYYTKFGNLDLEHFTQIGAKNGIPNYESYEIGKPVSVRFDGTKTFVKGHIVSGTGVAAEKANLFWSSLTEITPAKDWYPSVGGTVMGKRISIDPKSGERYPVIDKVRWTNIGFSRTPVNTDLATVSTVPFGILAKCWGPAGIDMRKSLAAGYGTDSAKLTGGSALGRQSLDGVASSRSRATKQQVLAKAATAMKAGHITGTEATEVETALNRGQMPRRDVLDRMYGGKR